LYDNDDNDEGEDARKLLFKNTKRRKLRMAIVRPEAHAAMEGSIMPSITREASTIPNTGRIEQSKTRDARRTMMIVYDHDISPAVALYRFITPCSPISNTGAYPPQPSNGSTYG
jgi:hypothetical protein